ASIQRLLNHMGYEGQKVTRADSDQGQKRQRHDPPRLLRARRRVAAAPPSSMMKSRRLKLNIAASLPAIRWRDHAHLQMKADRRPLLGLELCRFDEIAEAFVVAAHAHAELLRTFFQGLQTTLGQVALDVRIVLHRMNVPRERRDHERR